MPQPGDDPGGFLPFAYGPPPATGVIKQETDDFRVEERLSFTPEGRGEHVYVYVEKTGENTEHTALQLARFCGVRRSAVGYAGLKDRHGRTRQWFSIGLPGRPDPDWSRLASPSLRVLAAHRHTRKLKKGALEGNRFEITIRDVRGDLKELDERLRAIALEGVPNAFGPQRFGREGQNLIQARALFSGRAAPSRRYEQGLYLSAARSFLFNQILARRIERGTWNRAMVGDVFMFSRSHSFFGPAELTSDLLQRVADRTLHPSGALWGRGEPLTADDALALETAVAADEPELARGLERFGLDMDRRPLRVLVFDLTSERVEPGVLRLRFSLPRGAYATAVLRELIASPAP